MVKLFNNSGDETSIIAAVTEISVSEERKTSKDYQSCGRFVSLTAAVPDDLRTAAGLRQCAEELYATIDIIFADRDGSEPAHAQQPPGVEEEDVAATLAPSQKLPYAPRRAADRTPGQWWETIVTQYVYNPTRVDLYTDVSQYPVAGINKTAEYDWGRISKWLEYMKMDGAKHPFGKPIRLIQYVSDKVMTQGGGTGNYFVNIATIEIVRDESVEGF